MTAVSVIGAGAWGMALAIVAERSHKKVNVYVHEQHEYDCLQKDRCSPRLPGLKIPDTVHFTMDTAEAANANIVLVAVPAQVMRTAIKQMKVHLNPDSYIVLCSKGIELDTGLLMSEVVTEILPEHSVSVLSGPTFASEVAAGLPAVATLANPEIVTARWIASSLSNDRMRLYSSTDIVGIQIAGALKNVIAIAAGIATACELGENVRAALITRGLAEVKRLGLAMGGQEDTFDGLAGVGDLILTCTSPQSRNFSLGFSIGNGKPKDEKRLTEGAWTARAVLKLAEQLEVEMPVCSSVCRILDGRTSVADEISALWSRPLKGE